LSPAQQRRSRLDTIMPGISVSHVDGTAGTFGALVFDAATGSPYVLSNWHVLQGPTGAVGDDIVQPGPYDDGNTRANVMGRLVRSHLGVAGDCAVCSIVGRQVSPVILELDVAPKRIATVNLGDKVVKSGRTTGVSFGVVARVGVVVNIDYGGAVGSQTIGGFEIAPNPDKPPPNGEISMGGDSGSLWLVDTDGADKDIAVGLHFAGETDPNPDAEHAVACAIHSVFQKLQISFENPHALPDSQPARKPRRRKASK
jgi:endonuclease G